MVVFVDLEEDSEPPEGRVAHWRYVITNYYSIYEGFGDWGCVWMCCWSGMSMIVLC